MAISLKNYGIRMLRGYRRMAQKYHSCDSCSRDILPGDEYEGIVNVRKDGHSSRVYVSKRHIHPPCNDPLEDDEEARSAREDSMRQEAFSAVA